MICILALVCVCLQLSPAPMIDIISLIRPAEAYLKKKKIKAFIFEHQPWFVWGSAGAQQ